MGSKGRRWKKRQQLRKIQEALIRVGCWGLSDNMTESLVRNQMECDTPQEAIAQARHERRVFGHDLTPECGCTPREVDVLVAWNQPSELWTGGGDRLRRRLLNRRRRNRR